MSVHFVLLSDQRFAARLELAGWGRSLLCRIGADGRRVRALTLNGLAAKMDVHGAKHEDEAILKTIAPLRMTRFNDDLVLPRTCRAGRQLEEFEPGDFLDPYIQFTMRGWFASSE